MRAMTTHLSVRLEIPSAPDANLTVSKLRGREAISELYRFEVELWTPQTEGLDVDGLLGEKATLSIESERTPLRRIHGALRRLERVYIPGESQATYRAELVPSAHILRLITTTDVFSDELSAPELISRKLEQCDVPHDVSLLVGTYDARDFWVQWKESDWDFICRRAEHFGLSFWFSQQDDQDQLVFVDENDGFDERSESVQMALREGEAGVQRLEAATQCIPGVYVTMDYNYMTPEIDLTSESDSSVGFAGGTLEWGPGARTPAECQRLADVRREANDVTRRIWRGRASGCVMAAGQRVTFEGLPDGEEPKLLVTEVVHELAALEEGEGGQYRVEFAAVEASLPYRPQRRAPVPRIEGVLSAMIEPQEDGVVGNTAQLDEHGRYRVKFRFDTTELDGRASCPVRLVHQTTGPDYGMHFPLKPGIEVAVAFVNGDPDRPVILGALHNASVPAPVRDQNAKFSVVRTESGITMKMRDA